MEMKIFYITCWLEQYFVDFTDDSSLLCFFIVPAEMMKREAANRRQLYKACSTKGNNIFTNNECVYGLMILFSSPDSWEK